MPPRTTVYTLPHTYDGFVFMFLPYDGSHGYPHARRFGGDCPCATIEVGDLNRRTRAPSILHALILATLR
jgi:hypothetical protein